MTLQSAYKKCVAFAYKLKDDYINSFAAQAAFFIFLSFIPFVMFLLTMLNYLPISVSDLLFSETGGMLPTSVSLYIESILEDITTQSPGTLISITAISTVWSSSRGFFAIDRGLSFVYKTKDRHSVMYIRLRSCLYALIMAIMLVFMLVLIVFGNQLLILSAKYYPQIASTLDTIMKFKTLGSFVLMTIFFLIIFLFIPNRVPNFFAELPGALISTTGWYGFSFIYSFYVDHFGSAFSVYGNLTSVVICMLWLYVCMYIMFLGAEINSLFYYRITQRTRRRKSASGQLSKDLIKPVAEDGWQRLDIISYELEEERAQSKTRAKYQLGVETVEKSEIYVLQNGVIIPFSEYRSDDSGTKLQDTEEHAIAEVTIQAKKAPNEGEEWERLTNYSDDDDYEIFDFSKKR